MSLFTPPNYFRVKVARSFEELIATRFEGEINAVCWPRVLVGDFEEVAAQLVRAGAVEPEGMTTLDEELLRSLPLSDSGRAAVETLLTDQRLLQEQGLAPILDCIFSYPREEGGVVPTDVYSFHADSAPVAVDTYLCSYNQSSSEGLPNEQAVPRVELPEVRAELLREFAEHGEGGEFQEYLQEQCYDLHYAPAPGAEPYSFGIGNLWRIAVKYPGCPVPPCVHRAPEPKAGQSPRLLLIS